ncbi:MAG: hypothetical protein GC146_00525 [Limimaricola sp.]|uniref:DUF5681 domain-containing protein n=1 Tax=Limimaricola sp. TaxID=2211665 RepID=UPI001D722386|nr:DUF5681 domain-containing protein [Limimaricola sp.]MBI1415684.1 hypothetical protein [Limimaricola sp.]
MVEATEKTGQKQAQKGQFAKGSSGNPKGRPKGARGKATLAAETLMDGDAGAITKKAIELAKAGDLTAIRLCMERILPPRKSRPMRVTIPKINGPEDILKAVNAILIFVSSGRITTDEADALLRTVEAARKAMETEEVHLELDELQKRMEMIGA